MDFKLPSTIPFGQVYRILVDKKTNIIETDNIDDIRLFVEQLKYYHIICYHTYASSPTIKFDIKYSWSLSLIANYFDLKELSQNFLDWSNLQFDNEKLEKYYKELFHHATNLYNTSIRT